MKCWQCGKQLPRSRHSRSQLAKLIGHYRPPIYVHSVGCLKKSKNREGHIIWLFKSSLERSVQQPSGLKWMTDGDDPLVMIKDDSMIGHPDVYWSTQNNQEKFE